MIATESPDIDIMEPLSCGLSRIEFKLRNNFGDPRTVAPDVQKFTIGSDARCAVRLPVEDDISPVHCLVLRGQAGTVIRRWSDNTLLNGQDFDDCWLNSGDVLQIGGHTIEVVSAPEVFTYTDTAAAKRFLDPQTDRPIQRRSRAAASGRIRRLIAEIRSSRIDTDRLRVCVRELQESQDDSQRRIAQLTDQLADATSVQSALENKLRSAMDDKNRLGEQIFSLQEQQAQYVASLHTEQQRITDSCREILLMFDREASENSANDTLALHALTRNYVRELQEKLSASDRSREALAEQAERLSKREGEIECRWKELDTKFQELLEMQEQLASDQRCLDEAYQTFERRVETWRNEQMSNPVPMPDISVSDDRDGACAESTARDDDWDLRSDAGTGDGARDCDEDVASGSPTALIEEDRELSATDPAPAVQTIDDYIEWKLQLALEDSVPAYVSRSAQPALDVTRPVDREEISFSAPITDAPVSVASILSTCGHEPAATDPEFHEEKLATLSQELDDATAMISVVPKNPAKHCLPQAETDDEGAIDSYMSQLLKRVGGGATDSQHMPTQNEPDESAPVAVDTPIPSFFDFPAASEIVPRAKPPKMDLNSMRSLANETAKSAIDRHSRAVQKQQTGVMWCIAICCFLAGGNLLFWTNKLGNVGILSAVVLFIVGVYMGIRNLVQTGRIQLNVPPLGLRARQQAGPCRNPGAGTSDPPNHSSVNLAEPHDQEHPSLGPSHDR